MAWAAIRSDGSAAAVAFMQEQIALDDGMRLIEIDDALVIAVLEGQRSLQSLFEPAPTAAVELPPQRSAAQGVWSRRYPAVMSDIDLDALSQVAKLIPSGAIAVEVGSRLGGSARAIIEHAQGIKRLYCLDPEWNGTSTIGINDPWMDNLRGFWKLDQYQTCLEFAQHYMRDYPQVRLLPFASPDDIQWWREPVDFMFEDSSHENPQLRATLDFWVPLVKSGGIIAGHDYARHWTDVVHEVDALSARLGAAVQVQGTVWWMRKP